MADRSWEGGQERCVAPAPIQLYLPAEHGDQELVRQGFAPRSRARRPIVVRTKPCSKNGTGRLRWPTKVSRRIADPCE